MMRDQLAKYARVIKEMGIANERMRAAARFVLAVTDPFSMTERFAVHWYNRKFRKKL
jgi:hypothetical protein